jgi:hypothetical protein
MTDKKIPSTPRQEDLGFTEEMRPFEVHGIIVLLGYDAALRRNQHQGRCLRVASEATAPRLRLSL